MSAQSCTQVCRRRGKRGGEGGAHLLPRQKGVTEVAEDSSAELVGPGNSPVDDVGRGLYAYPRELIGRGPASVKPSRRVRLGCERWWAPAGRRACRGVREVGRKSKGWAANGGGLQVGGGDLEGEALAALLAGQRLLVGEAALSSELAAPDSLAVEGHGL